MNRIGVKTAAGHPNLANEAHVPLALAVDHPLSTDWKPPTHQLKSHTRDCTKGART